MKAYLYGKPETEREIGSDFEFTACDEYCHRYVNMRTGDVAFVVVDGEIWEVLCVLGGLCYYSMVVSEEEVQEKLSKKEPT